MAELLIRASKHWLDDHTQEQVDAMPQNEKESYNARCQIGDIVVVRPDGWKWGKEECLPTFVVVKVPDLAIEDANKYEESLMDRTDPNNAKMIRFRKNALAQADVLSAVSAKTDSIQLSKSFILTKVMVKTGSVLEVSAPIAEELM